MNHEKRTVALCTLLCMVFLFGNSLYAQTDVSLGKPATVNSWDSTGFGANGKGMGGSLANDGDAGTRWATDWQNDVNRDSGWIYIDLQAQRSIDSVVIKWETAGALHYAIQVANFTDLVTPDSLALLATDAPWTTVAEVTDGVSDETRTITFTPASARQVRVRGYSRTTTFGYSIWDFKCFDPTVSVLSATPARPHSQTRTVITPAAIKFFAPDIIGCKLFDIKGRCLLSIDQQAAASLTLDASGAAGTYIAKLTSKNGISTHRLMKSR
jgi:hypothetical protein